MLYSEFKSQFRNNENEYNGEYKVEDTRNFNIKEEHKQKTVAVKPKSKKRTFFKFFFVFVLIAVIAVSATLLYFELFTDNGIYTVFSKIATTADYYFCLTSGKFNSLDDAKANSDEIKSKGGAGYIFYDGKYNVLVSLYPDEKTANQVSEKHGYGIIKIFKSSPLKTIPPTLSGEYDKCKNFEIDLIQQLYNASALIENNLDKNSAQSVIVNAIANAQSKTNGFLKESEQSKLLDVQKYASKIKQVLNETEKIKNASTLSNIRQTMIFIAIVMA